MAVADKKCAAVLQRFRNEADPDKKGEAYVALNYCMASVLCIPEAESFMNALEEKKGGEGAAMERMRVCVVDQMVNLTKKGLTVSTATTPPTKLA